MINFTARALKDYLRFEASIFDTDREAIKKLIGRTQNEGLQLARFFKTLEEPVHAKTKEQLLEGFALGESNQQIAKRINDVADIGYKRALTISRTETNEAYRAATREFYREAGIKEYAWMSVLDVRTCLICWHLHGRKFKSAIKTFSHVNCRCTLVPFTGQKIETGAEKFARLEPGYQKQILGPKRYELFEQGKSLESFVGTREVKEVGKTHFIKPLDELKEPEFVFKSTNDPARKYYGAGRLSHPKE